MTEIESLNLKVNEACGKADVGLETIGYLADETDEMNYRLENNKKLYVMEMSFSQTNEYISSDFATSGELNT